MSSAILIQLIIVLLIVGVALWAINNYIPMEPLFKTLLNVVVFIAVLLYLAKLFGVF